jgi:hypothetical protein
VIAALFKKAAHQTQVLISTQSSSFLDSFDPEDVVVVNREGEESLFTRPDAAQLEAWLRPAGPSPTATVPSFAPEAEESRARVPSKKLATQTARPQRPPASSPLRSRQT